VTTERFATLAVRVQPGASRERLARMTDGTLKAAVSAPPEKGKANRAVERLLAKTLGLSVSAVRVVGGETSRRKTVRCDGIARKDLDERIAIFLKEQ